MDSFDRLVQTVSVLMGENGCPWDRVQTHESLKPCMLEECYEVLDAIDKKDDTALCEELGDVLLQVVFHSLIAQKEARTIDRAGLFLSVCLSRNNPPDPDDLAYGTDHRSGPDHGTDRTAGCRKEQCSWTLVPAQPDRGPGDLLCRYRAEKAPA